MNTKYFNWSKKALMVLLIIIICVLAMDRCGRKQVMEDQANTITGLNTELRKSVDKAGRETTRANSFELNYKDFKKIHAADSTELAKLQKIVDKKTRSAIVVTSTTSGTATGVTIVSGIDTLNTPCDSTFPTYKTSIHDQWSDFAVIANKDSTRVIYTINNEFSFKQTDEKQGKWPFRKNVPIVQVTNENPHTKTNGISAYAVSVPKQKRLGWFVAGGATAAVVITVIKILIPK